LGIVGDVGIGVGVLLVLFGPLLLIPITWLFYRFAVRPIVVRVCVPRVSEKDARLISWGVAVLAVVAALASAYFPGKRDFDQLCSEHATPRISDRVNVQGFFRSRLYPYEARRFLERFEFVEAPHMYKEGLNVRYAKAGDELREEEVTALRSVYGVQENLSELSFGITSTQKRIYEIATDRELAKASHITYQGGPLWLLLGSYGTSSCPDIRSEEGSRDFQTSYELETIVLREGAAAGK
jgi:hypothetical protein